MNFDLTSTICKKKKKKKVLGEPKSLLVSPHKTQLTVARVKWEPGLVGSSHCWAKINQFMVLNWRHYPRDYSEAGVLQFSAVDVFSCMTPTITAAANQQTTRHQSFSLGAFIAIWLSNKLATWMKMWEKWLKCQSHENKIQQIKIQAWGEIEDLEALFM